MVMRLDELKWNKTISGHYAYLPNGLILWHDREQNVFDIFNHNAGMRVLYCNLCPIAAQAVLYDLTHGGNNGYTI